MGKTMHRNLGTGFNIARFSGSAMGDVWQNGKSEEKEEVWGAGFMHVTSQSREKLCKPSVPHLSARRCWPAVWL